MCGLFSLFQYGTSSAPSINARDLRKPIESVFHRGPDDYGFDVSADGRCGLAHARLSIIDLEGGAQPLRHSSRDISLTVNGEFYDFEAIRESLQAQGHRFQTHSDSEIALHLYVQYGLDFVHHLRGEFALVLYDGTAKRLIAVRDRFGIKPLHYAIDETRKRLYIASEAKSILAAGIEPRWDENAYAAACQMQYLPPHKTLFKGVNQLEPGQMLLQNVGAAPVIKTYWDMDYPQAEAVENVDEAEATQQVHDLLLQSVSLRLRADVPVCCHLSGGIDSAAIAGMAAHLTDKPVACFTVSFAGHEAYDELPIAKEQAAHIGADLQVVPVSTMDMIDNIEAAVYKTEGLSINGHLAGKYLLSKAIAAAGYKVTLSGEGSDEIFAGYPHFREDILNAGGEGNALKAHLQKLYAENSKLAGVFLADGEALDTSAIEGALGYLPAFMRAKATLGFRVQKLLSADYKARSADVNAYGDIAAHFDVGGQLAGRSAVNQSSYLWTKLTLAGYILKTLGDGCEMAHSLEGRVPFLDHHLFAYVKTLPLDLKIRFCEGRGLQEKYILREVVKPYITQTLYNRQKHPFIAPPASSAQGLHEKLGDLLSSDAMRNQPFYDVKKVRTWFEDLRKSDEKTRITQEPVMMMLLTTLAAQQVFDMKG